MRHVVVTFDEVMRPMRSARNRAPCIEFGFRSGDVRHYAVCAWGAPSVRSGMTVTAVFPDKEDWQALVGWVDHETGEICCKSWTAYLWCLMFVPMAAAWSHDAVRTAPLGAAIVMTLASMAALAVAWDARSVWRAQRFLRARRAEIEAGRGGFAARPQR